MRQMSNESQTTNYKFSSANERTGACRARRLIESLLAKKVMAPRDQIRARKAEMGKLSMG
jgi:hypothetical protein